MAAIRQEKINALLKRELNLYFQKEARTLCKGAMVTATTIRTTRDFSLSKVYLSIWGAKKTEDVFKNISEKRATIRYEVGKSMKHSLRKIPEFQFFIDDSLDFAKKIDDLLK